jgi:hypothetical protein
LKNKMKRYVLLRLHDITNKPNSCFGNETWGTRKKKKTKKMEAAHMRFLGILLAESVQDRKVNEKTSAN